MLRRAEIGVWGRELGLSSPKGSYVLRSRKNC
jgi:hypothetical protein